MEALKLYGTLWFPGVGAKARMRDNSVRIDAKCEVQLREPDSGNRHFGCYKHWQDAIDGLAHIVGHGRHLFEIITHGRPCKPYLDLDGDEMPPGFESIQQVADRAQDLVTRIAKEDYGIDLQPEAFAWLHSGLQAKVSLHLVVSTHAPQFVFHSNHQADAQGALHLAQRIKQLDPDGVGSLVDLAVYTKDREMRMAFSTKYEKKQSMLVPMDPGKAMRDTVITWLDDDVQIINVPLHIPRAVKAASRGFKNPREAKGQTMPGHDPKDPSHLGFVRARMLDLLHERLHPSAFHEAAHGVEDPYDPLRGVKFGFSDRSESCYTGHTHPGAQNMRCFVGDASEVYLKCFSESCQDRPAFRIGPLHAEPETWSAHAVRVRMKYLDWEKQAEPPSEIDDDTDAERLDIAVRDWAAGRFKALNIRSPMATGKSTLLHGVLETLFRGKSVLIVTYRQTLAYEMSRKLDSLGFVSYLDQDGPLHDREVYPRVICQVDSFQRLAPLFGVPSFDVVILDEIESVLRHFGSATLAAPISVMESFVSMIETATSVLSMDAFWGAAAHDFIERCGVTQRLVINEYRGAPRTFVFDDDENAWQERIRSDLVDRQLNVVVVSMSVDAIARLTDMLQASGALESCDILVHSSKSDDDLKKGLRNVDALWSQYRLVAYSPTIEAGVDFSTPHFAGMYVYLCRLSATPLGLVQMTGRVRSLGSPEVHCCATHGLIQPQPCTRRMTVAEGRCYVRWMVERLQLLPRRVARIVDGQATHALLAFEGVRAQNCKLPADDPMLEVLAHCEAAASNASSRFFAELSDLLEGAGHVVRIATGTAERAAGLAGNDGENSAPYKSGMILASKDVRDEQDFLALRGRVYGNNATEDMKWRYTRHLYKACWGIDRIDALFLEMHGPECQSPQVMQLVRMLFPSLFLRAEAAPTQSRMLLKAPLIIEVIAALGFRSPFDTETVFREELTDVYETRLKTTQLFVEYEASSKLFRVNSRTPSVWDNPRVAKSLTMVLGSVGLRLDHKRDIKKVNGKATKVGPGEYRLDVNAVGEMAELLKLKTRGAHARANNLHAAEYLVALPYTRYGHLINDQVASASWRHLIEEA